MAEKITVDNSTIYFGQCPTCQSGVQIVDTGTTMKYVKVPRGDSSAALITELCTALERAAESVCSMKCPSVKKTAEEPWTHCEECESIRALLKSHNHENNA